MGTSNTQRASGTKGRPTKGGSTGSRVLKDIRELADGTFIRYSQRKGVDQFVRELSMATTIQLVDTERRGVEGVFLKDLSRRLDLTAGRLFDMLGVPKATAEKKVANGDVISGSGGQAAIGMARLIGRAQELVANSTAPEAKGFDAARWLGKWLEVSQPALGGRKPADLLDTPTGVDAVLRLLGALESGAYQ
jgi:putative toxin-antitoxin system antitoxin component (TIGR02293 family)